MVANPFLGLALISVGGAASASFYTPFKKVRQWSWQTYWLAFGCVSWLIGPWVAALLTVPEPLQVLLGVSPRTLGICYLYGALWGVGSLTNGLALRYLGLSLGYAIPLGLCSVLGTLVPPAMAGRLGELFGSLSGLIIVASVFVGLGGIAICAMAGIAKDRELPADQKQEAVSEFNFGKGVTLSVLAGVMSACMAFGIAAGRPITQAAVDHGAPELWRNAPLFIVLLLGGFTTNGIWCLWLGLRSGTVVEYVSPVRAPLLRNYLLCVLAGSVWYLQFLFYGMGETHMGRYGFAAWSVLMACIIIFSNLWGLAFREWRGTSPRTHRLIFGGLLVLTLSALMTALGGYLAMRGG